jgi:hypothetical protein
MQLYREAAERGKSDVLLRPGGVYRDPLGLGRMGQRGLCGAVYCRAIRELLQPFEP